MKRDPVIDIAKGIVIILMVIGHLHSYFSTGELYKHAHKLIYSFHMPFFFLTAGLYFRYKKSFAPIIFNKFRRLIIPWMATCFFYSLPKVLMNPELSTNTKAAIFISPYFSHGNFEGSWFLPCFFISQLLIFSILTLTKGWNFIFNFIVIILALFGMSAKTLLEPNIYSNFKTFFDIDVACVAIFFIFVGHNFRAIQFKKNLAILAVLALSFSFLFNNPVDMSAGRYENQILFLTGALSGSYLTVYLANIIYLHLSKASIFLSLCGRYSLWVLLSHGFALTVLQGVFRYL